MTPRQKIIYQVAWEILQLPWRPTLLIGIDGDAGSGKSTFALELIQTLATSERPIIQASIDSFHNPAEIRYGRGRQSAEGFFLDSHNQDFLSALLLAPLSPGGSRLFRRATFDHRTDSPVSAPEEYAEEGSILIFDGLFLHRPELRNYWDLSIYLDVRMETGFSRCAARGDGSADPFAESNSRYREGQLLYRQQCNPSDQATIVINNEDLDDPVMSCKERIPLAPV